MFSTLQSVREYGLYKNFTSSNLVKTGKGTVQGIIVNSHSSGTLQLSDALTSTTPNMTGTITLASGERWIPLFGATFTTGLYITVGGTGNFTIVYN